jgi:hypothetical protein
MQKLASKGFAEYKLPSRRVIFLGASNVRLSFGTVVAAARRTWGEPLEIMAAIGHGRSYGQDSTVFGRKISGIFPCALWQDLQKRPALPTSALVTDIGNDLIYGVPPEQVLQWVARCLDRLAEVGATTLVTELPVTSIARLSESRFRFFRRLFFPRSKLTFADAQTQIVELNQGLAALCEARKIPVIPVQGEWYGLDPIHLKHAVRAKAWPKMLAAWRGVDGPIEAARSPLRTSAYLARLAPHERSVFGIRRRRVQPSGRLADGTTISLY